MSLSPSQWGGLSEYWCPRTGKMAVLAQQKVDLSLPYPFVLLRSVGWHPLTLLSGSSSFSPPVQVLTCWPTPSQAGTPRSNSQQPCEHLRPVRLSDGITFMMIWEHCAPRCTGKWMKTVKFAVRQTNHKHKTHKEWIWGLNPDVSLCTLQRDSQTAD